VAVPRITAVFAAPPAAVDMADTLPRPRAVLAAMKLVAAVLILLAAPAVYV